MFGNCSTITSYHSLGVGKAFKVLLKAVKVAVVYNY